jgi:hypothetical protein
MRTLAPRWQPRGHRILSRCPDSGMIRRPLSHRAAERRFNLEQPSGVPAHDSPRFDGLELRAFNESNGVIFAHAVGIVGARQKTIGAILAHRMLQLLS